LHSFRADDWFFCLPIERTFKRAATALNTAEISDILHGAKISCVVSHHLRENITQQTSETGAQQCTTAKAARWRQNRI
jgi:hypothetical protein